MTKPQKTILIAAIAGALFPIVLMSLLTWADALWGRGSSTKSWHQAVQGVGVLLSIPAAMLSQTFGIQSVFSNFYAIYVVDGLLGAFIFAVIAVCLLIIKELFKLENAAKREN